MTMSNKTYDTLKYICLKVLPALATLILAIGTIWHIPYTEPVAATVTAINAFLGVLIGVSAKNYNEGA